MLENLNISTLPRLGFKVTSELIAIFLYKLIIYKIIFLMLILGGFHKAIYPRHLKFALWAHLFFAQIYSILASCICAHPFCPNLLYLGIMDLRSAPILFSQIYSILASCICALHSLFCIFSQIWARFTPCVQLL
jgi:hypothetical protein